MHARPLLHIGNVSKPQALAAGTATGHSSEGIPGLYNATGVPTAAGVTVGIITIGGVSQTLQDLKQFTSSNGYGTVSTQTIKTNGSGGSYTDDQHGREWDLDSQSIVGSAGGQAGKLVFYMADLNASGNTGLTQAAQPRGVGQHREGDQRIARLVRNRCERGRHARRRGTDLHDRRGARPDVPFRRATKRVRVQQPRLSGRLELHGIVAGFVAARARDRRHDALHTSSGRSRARRCGTKA